MRNAKRFKDGVTFFSSVAPTYAGEAVLDIFPYREMRKKSKVLENIANFSMLNWEIGVGGVVEKNTAGDSNSARIRDGQARDPAEQRGLPCPAWSEDDGDSRRDGGPDVERKVPPGIGKTFLELSRQSILRCAVCGKWHAVSHLPRTERLEPPGTGRFTKENFRLLISMATPHLLFCSGRTPGTARQRKAPVAQAQSHSRWHS